VTEAQTIELIEAGYVLDRSTKRRGFRAPDRIGGRGDYYLWPPEAADAHLQASRQVADDALMAAAQGDGYVLDPGTCPDTLSE
jgi:hypothetical protein